MQKKSLQILHINVYIFLSILLSDTSYTADAWKKCFALNFQQRLPENQDLFFAFYSV